MATYKQNCIFCDALIPADSRFCVNCGSRSPFALRCPTCHREVSKEDPICGGCGRPLYIQCPFCGNNTFAGDLCQVCHESLMVQCQNRRCDEMMFFQNSHCTACGKKLVKK
ncbi:MAG: double zinc ribbon domain-containing protein [Anaerovoracaceae bacterium]|jgi:RNA polymerase subunit RPABC4/transcription elongation factor Spt4